MNTQLDCVQTIINIIYIYVCQLYKLINLYRSDLAQFITLSTFYVPKYLLAIMKQNYFKIRLIMLHRFIQKMYLFFNSNNMKSTSLDDV